MSCGLSIVRVYWVRVLFAPLGGIFTVFYSSHFWLTFDFLIKTLCNYVMWVINWEGLLDYSIFCPTWVSFWSIWELFFSILAIFAPFLAIFWLIYWETDGPTGQHLHFQSSNGAKTENTDIYMFQIYIFQDPLSCSMESFWSQLISVDQC